MAEKSKDELVQEAQDFGVDPEGLTKDELQTEIEAHQTPELGVAAPPSGEPVVFESVGSITAVEPVEADDIPTPFR